MKSGVSGLSYAKQQRIYELIGLSKDRDNLKGGDMLSTEEHEKINVLLKEKIKLSNKVRHNQKEIHNIEVLRTRKHSDDFHKELEEKLHIGDEVVYNQKERLKELSCSRIAAIFNVCQTTIANLEGKVKRRYKEGC